MARRGGQGMSEPQLFIRVEALNELHPEAPCDCADDRQAQRCWEEGTEDGGEGETADRWGAGGHDSHSEDEMEW